MVTYDEILEYVLIESGQYIGDLDATLLNKAMFVSIIKKELAYYSRFKPLTKTRGFRLYNGKVFSGSNGEDIPSNIHEIARSADFQLIYGGRRFGVVSSNYWRYDKPVLTLMTADDDYIVKYSMAYEYNDSADAIENIEVKDKDFFDMLTGRFMQTLGRSRKAFIIGDLPIDIDGASMLDDGKELYNAAIENLHTSSDFFLFP